MKTPVYVRLSDAEQKAVEAGLRSSHAFVLRRCQILLASARGERVPVIARALSCNEQTVRNAIHAFNNEGLAALQEGSSRPHHIQSAFSAERVEQLVAMLHRSPRTYNKPTSLWTLDLVAQVSYEQGLSRQVVTGETIRATLVRFNIRWKRAKHWISSPDPEYARKKSMRDRLIELGRRQVEWAVGFLDETWWSRLSQPNLHAWRPTDQPQRLIEQTVTSNDPDPKALACYGLYVPISPKPQQMWLRFVQGRPVSAVTTQFLEWCCEQLAQTGKRVLVLIWDNATWHRSQLVRAWLRTHNQQVKQSSKGVRILSCSLPIKSPWLNPIEAKWVHGKKNVVEADRLLTAAELESRVYAYFACSPESRLSKPEQVA